LMSRRVMADGQGELQGAVASLYSLASILGPPLMSQLFGRFSALTAPVHLPGAAFCAAAALTTTCYALYWSVTRGRAVTAPKAEAVAP